MNPVLSIDVLVPLLAVLGVAGCLAAWRSTIGRDTVVRGAVTALRGGALAGLALIALNPGRWRTEVRNENSEWVMLLDRSASMSTRDVGGAARWDAAMDLARRAASAEADGRRMKIHTFSASLEPLRRDPADAATLAPDGESTDIVGPAAALLDRYQGAQRKLAGILLVSDGRHLGDDEGARLGLRARSMDAPIYGIALGGSVPRRDLEIQPARRHYTTFAGQEISVGARAINRNLGDIRATLRLTSGDGRELASREVALADGEEMVVDFKIKPGDAGFELLRVAAAPWPGESVTHNNEARIGVSTLAARIRVLFLEGSPHWDSKFVVQLLRRQPHLQVDTVHRVKEERFFRVESAAALEQETETVFPETPAALQQYDAVAFGKGAEYFLTPERIAMLLAFVRDHGGVVLYTRGKPYFGDLPALAPLDVAEWGSPVRSAFRWQPSVAGEQAGLFGEVLPGAGQPVWKQLTALNQATACRKLMPFTQVLAEGVPEDKGTWRVPVLLSRRVGKGMVVAVNMEGLWRFDFFPTDAGVSSLYKEFWVELFQWAVTQADFLPGRQVALRVAPSEVRPGAPVKATVYLRGPSADAAAGPAIRVLRDGRLVQEAEPRPVGGDAGERAAVLSLSEPGLYRIEASMPGATEVEASATLEVRPPASEREEVSADPAFLARLAEQSGGRIVKPEEIEDVVRQLAPTATPADTGTATWDPWWDRAWLLLALVGMLSGEWVVRRRNGLL
jgi:hypothetical protein